MSDKQHEAIRIANYLAASHFHEASEELRRLHWLNEEHVACLERKDREIESLRSALHSISLASQDSGSTREGIGLYARWAIAKMERGEA